MWSMNGSVSVPKSAQMKGTLCVIKPEMKFNPTVADYLAAKRIGVAEMENPSLRTRVGAPLARRR
jgi:hypothetical protein